MLHSPLLNTDNSCAGRESHPLCQEAVHEDPHHRVPARPVRPPAPPPHPGTCGSWGFRVPRPCTPRPSLCRARFLGASGVGRWKKPGSSATAAPRRPRRSLTPLVPRWRSCRRTGLTPACRWCGRGPTPGTCCRRCCTPPSPRLLSLPGPGCSCATCCPDAPRRSPRTAAPTTARASPSSPKTATRGFTCACSPRAPARDCARHAGAWPCWSCLCSDPCCRPATSCFMSGPSWLNACCCCLRVRGEGRGRRGLEWTGGLQAARNVLLAEGVRNNEHPFPRPHFTRHVMSTLPWPPPHPAWQWV